MKNILILSAGRRVELVQAFKQSIKDRNLNCKVYVADLNPKLASASFFGDMAFELPRATSQDYCARIMEICRDNNIGVVVPTIDTELMVLAENKNFFLENKVDLIVSSSSLVQKCRNKFLTHTLFNNLGVQVPRQYSFDALTFPCFIKPVAGSCSVGLLSADNIDDIPKSYLHRDDLMVMEQVDRSKFSEYTIDIYYDYKSHIKCVVPRKRIEVRGGEVSKGVTRKNAIIEYVLQKFDKLEGAIGCVTLQLFFNEETLDIFGIEINPRFGGGFPLSYAAGADFPGWILDEYFLKKTLAYTDAWIADLMMLRYDAKVLSANYGG